LLFALTVPRLWQRGMFLDGMTYAVVSRNMALGIGSFWSPSLSATVYAQFFEQPPLGLGLQAAAFWLFGDHFAVERIFSLIVFALHALLIAAIWRRLLPPAYDWLPLLFWALPAVVTWSVVNNMLENTQALFSTFAVFALLRTCGPATYASTVGWSALSAAAVVASVLAKGPVGLFPLAVPLFFLILRRDERPAHPGTGLVAVYGTFAGITAAILLVEPARHALQAFLSTHMAPVLGGERGTGSRVFDVARHLAFGAWGRMGALAALLWLFRRRKTPFGRPVRETWFFPAIGCAASLPIMVSPVLAGHYFLPSLPFFALGFAAIALPAVASFKTSPGSLAWRAPAWIAVLLLAAVVVVLTMHGPVEVRDARMVRSMDRIATVAPRGATIGACSQSAGDWGVITYLQRFYRISLAADDAPRTGWFLATPGACAVPATCQLAAEAETFSLFRCDSATP
jgi:4-amino-4-deoxy-L-arabinose transferase-like glycosyltransferase